MITINPDSRTNCWAAVFLSIFSLMLNVMQHTDKQTTNILIFPESGEQSLES